MENRYWKTNDTRKHFRNRRYVAKIKIRYSHSSAERNIFGSTAFFRAPFPPPCFLFHNSTYSQKHSTRLKTSTVMCQSNFICRWVVHLRIIVCSSLASDTMRVFSTQKISSAFSTLEQFFFCARVFT